MLCLGLRFVIKNKQLIYLPPFLAQIDHLNRQLSQNQSQTQTQNQNHPNSVPMNQLHGSPVNNNPTNNQNFITDDERTEELNLLKLSIENLKSQITHKNNEIIQITDTAKNKSNEVETWKQKCHAYQDVNNQLSMIVKDREEKINSANKEIFSLKQQNLSNQQTSKMDPNKGLIQDSSLNLPVQVVNNSTENQYNQDELNDEILCLKKELDDAIKTAERRRIEAQTSKDQNTNYKIENDKLKKEVVRLKQAAENLLENHNEELFFQQEREQNALTELAKAETRLKNLQFADASEGQQAKIKVDQLTEDNRLLKKENQRLAQNVANVEELKLQQENQAKTYKAFLENLQQTQQEQFADQLKKHDSDTKKIKNELRMLKKERDDLKNKMANQEEFSDSASYAKVQKDLSQKDKQIKQLTQIVGEQRKEFMILQEHQKKLVKEVKQQRDGLVELPLIKNLVIQYISLQKPQQKEPVLRLISQVLKLSSDELEEILQVSGCKTSGFFGGFFGGSPKRTTAVSLGASLKEIPKSQEAIIAERNDNISNMFIQFLEAESNIRQDQLQFPANQMAAAYVDTSKEKSRRESSDMMPMGVTDMSLSGSAFLNRNDDNSSYRGSEDSWSRARPSLVPYPANSTRNEIAGVSPRNVHSKQGEEPIVLSSMSGGINTVLPSVQQRGDASRRRTTTPNMFK